MMWGRCWNSSSPARLEDHITSRGNLSPNQYGFRKNLSTGDAVRKLDDTIAHATNDGKFCLAISLDIKNVFNSIKWPDILAALENWEVPSYLLLMFQSYFLARSGTVSFGSGSMEVEISGGVPQGFVVGPFSEMPRSTLSSERHYRRS